MKLDKDDINVFCGQMTLDEANAWLMGDDADLSMEANEAIDEAASFASAYGSAYVIIEIKKAEE